MKNLEKGTFSVPYMKILFLHNYFHIKSGSGVVMFQEAELLKENGHEVHYFCMDKEPYYDENYEYIGYFPKYRKLRQPFYNAEAVRKFGLLLDKVKPDIVHEHTITFHLTPAILNECYKRKIPVVRTIHSFEKTADNDKKVSLKPLLSKSILAFYDLMGYYKGTQAYIFPSKALAERGQLRNFPKEKSVVIHNFVKNDDYKVSSEGKGSYFLYLGRLIKEKGIYNLIEAWKGLPRDIELHLVGTGEEESNLKKVISEYNLENIKLVGFIEGDDLKKEYADCIASILPSIWFEPFGLTILESFCFSKPVIASNIGGIPEIIKNNENGILIEPGNIQELKTAVLRLYNNLDLAKEMGIKGKQTAETVFTPQIHYEGLMKTYEKARKNFVYQ